jgi:hypothetical protein
MTYDDNRAEQFSEDFDIDDDIAIEENLFGLVLAQNENLGRSRFDLGHQVDNDGLDVLISARILLDSHCIRELAFIRFNERMDLQRASTSTLTSTLRSAMIPGKEGIPGSAQAQSRVLTITLLLFKLSWALTTSLVTGAEAETKPASATAAKPKILAREGIVC